MVMYEPIDADALLKLLENLKLDERERPTMGGAELERSASGMSGSKKSSSSSSSSEKRLSRLLLRSRRSREFARSRSELQRPEPPELRLSREKPRKREMTAPAAALAASLAAGGYADLAEELRGLGPCGIARLTSVVSQRIDLPLPLRQQAHAVHGRAEALNPGERSAYVGGNGGGAPARSATQVDGWWTVAPKADVKVTRAA